MNGKHELLGGGASLECRFGLGNNMLVLHRGVNNND